MFPTAQPPEALTHQVVAGIAVTYTAETATTERAWPYPLSLGVCRPRAAALDLGQDWSKQQT